MCVQVSSSVDNDARFCDFCNLHDQQQQTFSVWMQQQKFHWSRHERDAFGAFSVTFSTFVTSTFDSYFAINIHRVLSQDHANDVGRMK